MKILVVPTSHKEFIFLYVGSKSVLPNEATFAKLRQWVKMNHNGWPNNFPVLQKTFPKMPLQLEIFPKCNPERQYVFLLEGKYEATSADIKRWTQVLQEREDDTFTVLCYSTYFESIKRVNKNLIPFI